MYANWNRCIERARGKYVYIATSDDTMAPDCLEKLVAALERHPGCDVAHCALKAIDEHGRELPDTWAHGSSFAASSGPFLQRPHVRVAPFDGLLHLLGGSVYLSITQLLIRRSLFDRIGLFESTWGSLGDFNWDMRAGLVANTVHVPDTWGGWRVHTSQATARIAFGSAEHARAIDAMIAHAAGSCQHLLAPALGQLLSSQWLSEAAELRAFTRDVAARRRSSALRRVGFIARRSVAGSAAARDYVKSRLLRRPPSDWVASRLKAAGFAASLVPTTTGLLEDASRQPDRSWRRGIAAS
jgi:hypothetical protein